VRPEDIISRTTSRLHQLLIFSHPKSIFPVENKPSLPIEPKHIVEGSIAGSPPVSSKVEIDWMWPPRMDRHKISTLERIQGSNVTDTLEAEAQARVCWFHEIR